MEEITYTKFKAYKTIQESGVTNMMNVLVVVELSKGILNKEDCLEIMKNYPKYKKAYDLTEEIFQKIKVEDKEELTVEKLDSLGHGEIIATGTGAYPSICSQPITWVAVVGGIHDWAIYYALSGSTIEYICDYGDKVFSHTSIKELVPCTEDALARYRR